MDRPPPRPLPFRAAVALALAALSMVGFPAPPSWPALQIQRESSRPRSNELLRSVRPADFAEGRFWWVAFVDKGDEAARDPDAALARAWDALDPKARARRTKHGVGPDFADLPVPAERIAALVDSGAKVRAVSRWFNAASVEASPEAMARVAALPFVAFVRPVDGGRVELPADALAPTPVEVSASPPAPVACGSAPRGGFSYGLSLAQLERLNVPAAHAAGFTGAGVRVGVIDTGFRRTHEALAPISVVAERDFLFGDDNTADEPGDDPNQDHHGSRVLALLAGRRDGSFYGAAPGVEVVLAKTQSVAPGAPNQPGLFIVGYEYCEAMGCDAITSSLGYDEFPDGFEIEFDDLDGKTLAISLAVGEAYRRGVVCVNAVGNSFAVPPLAPNDAQGVLSCGQLDANGDLTITTSDGPLVDGRIKPELVAQGTNAYHVSPATAAGYFVGGMGTSYAAPQIAGVCALILQANPEWKNWQARDAILSTASNGDAPENGLGWGRPDALAASQREFPATGESTGLVAR